MTMIRRSAETLNVHRRNASGRRALRSDALGRDCTTYFIDPSRNLDPDQRDRARKLIRAKMAERVAAAKVAIDQTHRRRAATTRGEREAIAILDRVRAWAGGDYHALEWYQSMPIAALGCRTGEALVEADESAALNDYLDRLALGAYA
ncbi:hypothetical protein GI374_14615 [Paracoccus sp. S-4012]|uniref:hypothetical protein n=1 Tax=Paracoccus sp. S-4012 TaxID=2665648 RepID=UPI0012B0B29A|nr:hypothetical protein [Paracoccus sp. S-4012]MRX51645.1 hypothetical protein [Paracoccus sp. S-4012]